MSIKAILSKSTFIKGLQCEKKLFLYKHHNIWQDKISEMQQSVFNRGHRVGALAQTLFPNGIDASPSSPRAYAKAIEHTKELIDRIVDLMDPFQKKWYYTPKMHESYSIKKVLPALVPDLSYDGLEVADGGTACIVYEQLPEEMDMIKMEETRNNLLKYCKLDTLAMVKILDNLR